MEEFKFHAVKDWSQTRWSGSEAWVHADDLAWVKELASNIRKSKDKEQIRIAEMEFHKDISERYTPGIASALLLKIWKMSENKNEDLW